MADDGEQLGLATGVTTAWLSNPHTRAGAEEVTAMLASVLGAIRGLGEPSSQAASATPSSAAEHRPAVTKRKSLASPDYIISMIDGTKHRSLTRHLRNQGLTPGEYRDRYGLKADYPMVAPNYSEARRATAKQHNFGRKVAEKPSSDRLADEPSPPQEEPTPKPGDAAAHESAAPPKRRRLGIAGARSAAKAHLGTGGNEVQSTAMDE